MRPRISSAPIQLAVLPFAPTGDDPGAKAFCDGLTETLAAKLTQLTSSYPLQVVPTSEIRAESITSVEQARKDFGVTNGKAIIATADQSIQAGDKGWGFALDTQAYRRTYFHTMLYFSGSWLFNPRNTNGVPATKS